MTDRGGRVEVEGLAQLRRELKALGDDLADLKAANERAARIVADASAARAPHRTGRLASSLRPARAAGRASVIAGSGAVPYAGPIHWGWVTTDVEKGRGRRRNIPANPFATEAAEATRPQWLAEYETELQKALDRVRGAR